MVFYCFFCISESQFLPLSYSWGKFFSPIFQSLANSSLFFFERSALPGQNRRMIIMCILYLQDFSYVFIFMNSILCINILLKVSKYNFKLLFCILHYVSLRFCLQLIHLWSLFILKIPVTSSGNITSVTFQLHEKDFPLHILYKSQLKPSNYTIRDILKADNTRIDFRLYC